jgi:eukaryotic-like serine/threonine-protein kinase
MADQKVLGGRYELDSTLGRGGMAEVYLGTDRVLGRQIAVKVLGSQFSKDSSFVTRFRREAQSAAALNHPNVVSVFDTGSDDGTHFIVMEYVQGKTLSQVIRESGPLMPERAVEIALAVAEALAFAHRNSIIHRDIKPGNVMLTPSGDVKVMDFGIARATTSESLTQTATVLGTATYFSPEQAQGEAVDARSDVYSLGCVLYEMLTGHPPFSAETPVAVAYKHVKEEPVPPSRLNPDVPPDLDAIVLKCLAKNPANRYQSAQELVRDLERLRAGVPVMATPVLSQEPTQVVERATRPTTVLPPQAVEEEEKRRRWIAWLILGAILLVIAVGLFFFARSLLENGQLLTVPDVRGKTEAVARDTLVNAGFTVGNVSEVDSAEEKGIVVDYDPKEAERGQAINLFVSNASEAQANVPNVICQSRSSAANELRDRGFEVRVVGTFNNPACNNPGDVTQQDPVGNTQAPEGSVVRIWLLPEPSPSPTEPSPSPTEPSPPPTEPSPSPTEPSPSPSGEASPPP